MAQYTPAQLAELRELSASMLATIRQAIRENTSDPRPFLDQMRQLATGYGMGGFAYAVRAWLDTVIDTFPQIQRGEIHGIAFTNETRDGFVSAQEMPFEYRWAATALSARMRDDQVALYKLIGQVPPDRAGVYALRVLDLVAGALEDLDRGDRTGPLRTGDVLVVQPVDV